MATETISKIARAKGLKKLDAKFNMVLSVHDKDIYKAQAKNSKCCAFALAAKYLLPSSVQKEIVSFDRFKIMEPGVYHITAPGKGMTMKAINKRTSKRPNRHTKVATDTKRRLKHMTTNVRAQGAIPND